MADTTLLNALSPRPSAGLKTEPGNQRDGSADPFSSVLNTVHQSKSSKQGEIRRDLPQRNAQTESTRNDRKAAQSQPSSEASGAQKLDGGSGAPSNDKAGAAPAANDDESGIPLTDEQREAFESLPQEQQDELKALAPERMADILQMMVAQQQSSSAMAPEVDAILADLSDADLERLQGILNDLARVFGAEGSLEDKLSQAQQIIDEQLNGSPLAGILTQQLGDIVASSDKSGAEALAQWLAGAQLVVAQQSSAQHQNKPLATSTSFTGSSADIASGADNLVKLTTIEQTPEGLDLALESGKLLEAAKVADTGKFSEVAKLHNLFSARGNEEGVISTTNASALLTSAQKLAASSEQAPVLQSQLGTRFGTGAWGDAVGQKILWMAKQNITTAELRLDPPDLGPMQVRVSVQNDQAQITFTSQQTVVREALDQNAFRLREMLAEQGMTQVDVNVSGQGQQGGENGSREAEGGSEPALASADIEEPGEPSVLNSSVVRLIDQYA
ncbi:flagellar hook-length control protein FliK [Gilvimarinus chinensis]|uniref:flagellar hook-length control protein FliK n=1 Tax=Gilvimarinus chinensis TaxID=396005 RepID=UPI0003810821|nr:flagellar hook-length control protein FliK [Gilvimarinus chinensis]